MLRTSALGWALTAVLVAACSGGPPTEEPQTVVSAAQQGACAHTEPADRITEPGKSSKRAAH
jgi:hypothetical protein